jgi:hypothetical protein
MLPLLAKKKKKNDRMLLNNGAVQQPSRHIYHIAARPLLNVTTIKGHANVWLGV